MQPSLPIRLPELVLAGLVAACSGERGGRPSAAPGAPAATAEPSRPGDSLVLRTPSGTELWFALAREERDSAGTPCLERTLEIRSGSRRVPVPLLYTRDGPRLINDSTVSARIWNRCAPGDEYRINLGTGQPVRVHK
jgi:hypothetical protein